MKFNWDSDKILVLKDGDGGDAAAEMGRYFTGTYLNRHAVDCCLWDPSQSGFKLLYTDTQILRYNKPPYNDPKDVSRDQTMPMEIAKYFWGTKYDRNSYDHLMSKLRCPNGDLIGPGELAVLLRMQGNRKWYMPVLDLANTVGLLIQAGMLKYDLEEHVGKTLNLTLYLAFSKYVWPTWVSRFNCWLFGKICPKGVQYSWDRYYRPETGNNPVNELWRPIISEVFYGVKQ